MGLFGKPPYFQDFMKTPGLDFVGYAKNPYLKIRSKPLIFRICKSRTGFVGHQTPYFQDL